MGEVMDRRSSGGWHGLLSSTATKNMKQIALLSTLLLSTSLIAQHLPQPSPRGQVSQTVGLTQVSVDYGRPSMNGRKIFGGLVPFGEVWRTGANECTAITFDGPVQFGANQVPAGTYALFVSPGEKSSTVILNKDAKQWGAYAYKAESDVAKETTNNEECGPTEVFTISFGAFKQDAARLDLSWDKTRISVWITAPSDAQAQKNIAEALAKPDAGAGTYSECADFYLSRGLDKAQALAWAKKSVEMKKMYWNNFTLANALHATGSTKEAVVVANESATLAEGEGDKGAAEAYRKQAAAWAVAAK
jgi:Protein of unknown function (DUF2911)